MTYGYVGTVVALQDPNDRLCPACAEFCSRRSRPREHSSGQVARRLCCTRLHHFTPHFWSLCGLAPSRQSMAALLTPPLGSWSQRIRLRHSLRSSPIALLSLVAGRGHRCDGFGSCGRTSVTNESLCCSDRSLAGTRRQRLVPHCSTERNLAGWAPRRRIRAGMLTACL